MEPADESEDEDDLYPTQALFALVGVPAGLGQTTLEDKISVAFNFVSGQVSVMEIDQGTALFVVNPASSEEEKVLGGQARGAEAEAVVQKMNKLIASGELEWLGAEATCSVVTEEEMEEEVLISEEDALQMWRDMSEGGRTAHLAAVPSPDGELVMPTYEAAASAAVATFVSPTLLQLERDPTLLDLDNVPRVDVAQLDTVSWTEPVMITGVMRAGLVPGERGFARAELVDRFGDAHVRTGNRNTLVENGFVNSKPVLLREAMTPAGGRRDPECADIVFSPVKELPELLQQDLAPLIAAFPCEHAAQGRESVSKKFTLCLGNEGFGIGFHRHNAAMFFLVAGRKKWYMGPHETQYDTPTHPGFYTTKSTHKCVQQAGEVLYVPDQWYHEIFNLEYTAGIQALPIGSDEQ